MCSKNFTHSCENMAVRCVTKNDGWNERGCVQMKIRGTNVADKYPDVSLEHQPEFICLRKVLMIVYVLNQDGEWLGRSLPYPKVVWF